MNFPSRIVCLTEETAEILYDLGAEDLIVGISGYTVRPKRARKEKPKVSAFITAKIDKILDLKPDLVLGFSDLQSEICSTLINEGINVLCFNQRSISEILNVRSQIDQDVLESAIEALANAKRVEVYAFGGSAPVAMDAQHKFFRLKISSSFISDPHIQLMSANSLSKNDIVLAISQSGTTSALIDSVKIVRKSGVKVIGIMPENSPLANICDYPISINVGDNYRITKPHTSRIAYTAVIDVMTMGIAQLKPEAQEHLYNIVDSQRSLKIK